MNKQSERRKQWDVKDARMNNIDMMMDQSFKIKLTNVSMSGSKMCGTLMMREKGRQESREIIFESSTKSSTGCNKVLKYARAR